MSTPCNYCNRTFNGERGLNLHLRHCKSAPRETCSHCNKNFINLSDHILKCKDNPDNHNRLCKYCGEHRINLQTHVNSCRHNPDNMSTCRYCNEKYAEFGLTDHLKICKKYSIEGGSNTLNNLFVSIMSNNDSTHRASAGSTEKSPNVQSTIQHVPNDRSTIQPLPSLWRDSNRSSNVQSTIQPLPSLWRASNSPIETSSDVQSPTSNSSIERHVDVQSTVNTNDLQICCMYCNEFFGVYYLDAHERNCELNPNRVVRYIVHDYRNNNIKRENPINEVKNESPIEDQIADLNRVIETLSTRLNYSDSSDLLQEHDLCCSVCYLPTSNKTKCNHSICNTCCKEIHKKQPAKCPICRSLL